MAGPFKVVSLVDTFADPRALNANINRMLPKGEPVEVERGLDDGHLAAGLRDGELEALDAETALLGGPVVSLAFATKNSKKAPAPKGGE